SGPAAAGRDRRATPGPPRGAGTPPSVPLLRRGLPCWESSAPVHGGHRRPIRSVELSADAQRLEHDGRERADRRVPTIHTAKKPGGCGGAALEVGVPLRG